MPWASFPVSRSSRWRAPTVTGRPARPEARRCPRVQRGRSGPRRIAVTAQPSAPQIRAYRKFGRSEPAGRESRKLAHNLSEAVAVSNRVVVMTSTPAPIVAIIPIDLPRPRPKTHGFANRLTRSVSSNSCRIVYGPVQIKKPQPAHQWHTPIRKGALNLPSKDCLTQVANSA